jgi:hypothetical protein
MKRDQRALQAISMSLRMRTNIFETLNILSAFLQVAFSSQRMLKLLPSVHFLKFRTTETLIEESGEVMSKNQDFLLCLVEVQTLM